MAPVMKPPVARWHKDVAVVGGEISLAISTKKMSRTELTDWAARLAAVSAEMVQFLSEQQ